VIARKPSDPTNPLPASRFSWAHGAYIVAIVWKGFDGLVEFGGGAVIGLFGPAGISKFVQLTAPELETYLRSIAFFQHGASVLAQTYRFATIYLLIHGILKFGLAMALLRERHIWVFPVSVALLSAFVAYMTYRLTVYWSYWLLSFALFDCVTIALVMWEWRSRLAVLPASAKTRF
jgi:uncharacterized membrane protein